MRRKKTAPRVEPIPRTPPVLVLRTGERAFYAVFKDGPAPRALIEKLSPARLPVTLWEERDEARTGVLPWSLPGEPERCTLRPGDLALGAGNVLVLSFGEQTGEAVPLASLGRWEELRETLAQGSGEITLGLEWSE